MGIEEPLKKKEIKKKVKGKQPGKCLVYHHSPCMLCLTVKAVIPVEQRLMCLEKMSVLQVFQGTAQQHCCSRQKGLLLVYIL